MNPFSHPATIAFCIACFILMVYVLKRYDEENRKLCTLTDSVYVGSHIGCQAPFLLLLYPIIPLVLILDLLLWYNVHSKLKKLGDVDKLLEEKEKEKIAQQRHAQLLEEERRIALIEERKQLEASKRQREYSDKLQKARELYETFPMDFDPQLMLSLERVASKAYINKILGRSADYFASGGRYFTGLFDLFFEWEDKGIYMKVLVSKSIHYADGQHNPCIIDMPAKNIKRYLNGGKIKDDCDFSVFSVGRFKVSFPEPKGVLTFLYDGKFGETFEGISEGTEIMEIDFSPEAIAKVDEYLMKEEERQKEIAAAGAVSREKREIETEKQRIKERLRQDDIRKKALLELEEEGLIFPEAGKRPPIPKDVVDAIWRRDGGQCVYCGSKENLQIDHIIPFSKGGSSNIENLQLLCQKCNLRKSNHIG